MPPPASAFASPAGAQSKNVALLFKMYELDLPLGSVLYISLVFSDAAPVRYGEEMADISG